MKRREFLKTMGSFGVAAGLPAGRPLETVRVGVIGLGARGSFHDVYDAASWSAIAPLSERSVANRSLPVDVPDFTRGRYKSRQPLQVARASESGRFPVSLPARNQERTNERKMPS